MIRPTLQLQLIAGRILVELERNPSIARLLDRSLLTKKYLQSALYLIICVALDYISIICI